MKEYTLTCKIEIEKKKTPIGYWLVDGARQKELDINDIIEEMNEKIQNSD